MPYNFLGLAVSRSSDASQSNARSSKTNSTSLTALAGCSVTLWHRAFEQFEQDTPIHTSPDTIWIEISPRLCHHRLHSPHQGGSGAMTFERTEVIICFFNVFFFFKQFTDCLQCTVPYSTYFIVFRSIRACLKSTRFCDSEVLTYPLNQSALRRNLSSWEKSHTCDSIGPDRTLVLITFDSFQSLRIWCYYAADQTEGRSSSAQIQEWSGQCADAHGEISLSHARAFWIITPDIMIDFAQICSITNYRKHHDTGDAKSYASPTLWWLRCESSWWVSGLEGCVKSLPK